MASLVGGLLVPLCLIALGPASAAAAAPVLPVYDGAMTFAAIQDPSGPEEYSWEVELAEDEELVQIDDQHAEIYLTVHHRTGNPAAGGAPFEYPIIAGKGWEGGLRTETVIMPPSEQKESEAAQRDEVSEACLVPSLKGRSLKAAKKRLEKAGCKIGKVKRLKGAPGRAGRVVKQGSRPSVVLAPSATVDVTLGEYPAAAGRSR